MRTRCEMVGLIPKVLLDLVEERGGAAAREAVRLRAGLPADAIHRIDQDYPDEEWRRLLAAACEVLGVSQAQALEAYADFFCRDALQRWPMWWKMSASARQFLERQPVVHNCFMAGLRSPQGSGAAPDKFCLEKRERELIMRYRSANQLCDLYKALAAWVIRYYGEDASISESHCMQLGHPECVIHVRWPAAGESKR